MKRKEEMFCSLSFLENMDELDSNKLYKNYVEIKSKNNQEEINNTLKQIEETGVVLKK